MSRGLPGSFVLRRMSSSRLLLGSVLLAVFITAALTAALVTFSARGLPKAASRQLTTAPNLSISISGQIDATQAAADTAVIRSAVRAAFAAVPVRVERALWSDPLGLPASSASGAGQTIPLTEAATADHIASKAILVSGAWPGPPSRGQPIPAALPAAVAAQLHLAEGQVLSLPDRDTGAPVRFRLTGTFRPRDPGSPYWSLDLIGPSGVLVQGNFVTYGPLIVAPAAFGGRSLPVGQASWLAEPAPARISTGDISHLAARISQAENRLRQPGALGGLTVTTSVPQLLTSIASNLVVARSLLIISVLQLVLLAVAAIALAARMLAGQRAEESALLRARGVTRWQLARLTLAESVMLAAAAAVAGTLAGTWLARPLARVGPLHAAQLRISGFAWSAWWAAAAILVLCTIIMLGPAVRPVQPAAARISRGRQAKVAGAAQAGADLAVIALGLLAAWQLRSYSAVARSASGSIRIDPVLVAAPALILAGAALIPLRLLPALASVADRLSARSRRLGAALASWQVSRRPIRQSGPVLLVVLAVATGTLALAQHASWEQAAQDQAAFAVGSDMRVDLGTPVPLGRVAAIQHAPGISSAMPVASFNGGNGGAVIALDSRQAADTVAMRPDESALPLGELWKKITPARAGPGQVLPGRPARLELTASARLRSGGGTLSPMSVTMSIQDAAGIGYSVAAGRLPVDGRRHQLVAVLSPTRQASYPLRLLGISLDYQLPAIPAPPFAPPTPTAAAKRAAAAAAQRTAEHIAARQAVLTISGFAVSASAAGRFGRFATASALQTWHPTAGSQDLANPHASGSVPVVTGWQAAPGGARMLEFSPGSGSLIQHAGYPPLPVSGQLTLTAAAPQAAAVLPAIATRAFLSSNQAAVGSVLFAAAGPVKVPVRIVAAIREFPTMGAGSALIIDQRAIQELLARKSAAPLPVTAWWLRTAGPVTLTAAGLPPDATVAKRASVAAALLSNPLSAAPQQGVLAIAVAAAVLAAVGFSVSVAASMRERRTQSALLAALGVSRAAQAGQLCLEQLLLSGPAATVGLLLGAGIAHLLIPAVTLTASAAAPIPPTVINLPLGWAVGLAVVVTAVPVLAAAATVVRRPDPAAQLRAAGAV
jgi:FtsX-like permease family